MKPPYRLVPDKISEHTVTALEELLAEARKGRIIGVGFIAIYRERKYIVNTAGEARRSPTFTRGALQALDDELSRMIREQ